MKKNCCIWNVLACKENPIWNFCIWCIQVFMYFWVINFKDSHIDLKPISVSALEAIALISFYQLFCFFKLHDNFLEFELNNTQVFPKSFLLLKIIFRYIYTKEAILSKYRLQSTIIKSDKVPPAYSLIILHRVK